MTMECMISEGIMHTLPASDYPVDLTITADDDKTVMYFNLWRLRFSALLMYNRVLGLPWENWRLMF